MAAGYQSWPLVRFGVIGEAWRRYKEHWFVWSVTMLIVMCLWSLVVGALFSIVGGGHVHGPGGFRLPAPGATGIVPGLLSWMVSGFLVGGMVRMASNQLRGRAPRIEDLFSVTDCWFDLLLTGLLYGAAWMLGIALFIIPGLVVSGLFMLAVPLVVEGRMPATGALIQSWTALKSQWLVAMVFQILLFLVSMSGLLLCGVGVLATGPLYCLAIAILHRDFFSASHVASFPKHPTPFAEL